MHHAPGNRGISLSVSASQNPSPRILLVHGLLNADWWLRPLAAALRREGYEPRLFGYPSVLGGPAQAIPRLAERLRVGGVAAIVGHSLGGLIALEALRAAPDAGIRRVVCLGSPLRGSATARTIASRAWSRPLLGRSAPMLQAGLRDWDGEAEVGVIAGDVPRGLGRLFSRFEGTSDGTVGVEETCLPGIADHCIVHCSHTGLVFSRDVVAQTLVFLREGRFRR